MVIASAFVRYGCLGIVLTLQVESLIKKHHVTAQAIKLIHAAKSYIRKKKIDIGSITGIYNLEFDLYDYCSNRGLG
jgi:hypothetical protein